jgi:hypothetical protein
MLLTCVEIGRPLQVFPLAVPDVQVSKHPAPGLQSLLHRHQITRAVFREAFRHCLKFFLVLDLYALLGLRLSNTFLRQYLTFSPGSLPFRLSKLKIPPLTSAPFQVGITLFVRLCIPFPFRRDDIRFLRESLLPTYSLGLLPLYS